MRPQLSCLALNEKWSIPSKMKFPKPTPPKLPRAAILTMVFSDNMQDLSGVEVLNYWSLPDQKNHYPPITSITIYMR